MRRATETFLERERTRRVGFDTAQIFGRGDIGSCDGGSRGSAGSDEDARGRPITICRMNRITGRRMRRWRRRTRARRG